MASVRAQPPRPAPAGSPQAAKGGPPLGRGFIVDRASAAPVAGGFATGRGRRTMTKKADFKQRVRARMVKTGESYAAARSRVLAEQPGLPVPADQAMLAALHVSNGDCTDLPGTRPAVRVVDWRD